MINKLNQENVSPPSVAIRAWLKRDIEFCHSVQFWKNDLFAIELH